jgi:hypothetical protein
MAKSVEKQMELFEPVERGFQDGGLMDEGGTVDPISGNDVPPGSTQEEVRDDIPAQLSEGEFVFPADVVRYFGLEKLMEMRQEAKMGLQRMEDMGQMGNSEEAIMPDNLPFDIEDLDIDEEGEYNDTMEMARGGVVHAAAGTFMTPSTGFSYQAPATTGQTGYSAFRGTPAPAGATPLGYTTPTMAGPTYTTATGTTNLPTFGQTVGSAQTTPTTYKTYVNAAGQTQQIPFQNGKPLYPIPTGFTLQSTTPTTATTPTTTTGGQTYGGGGDDGRDGNDVQKLTKGTGPTFKSMSGGLFKGSSAYNKAVGSLSLNQLGSLSLLASVGSSVFGLATPNTKGAMMNQARNYSASILGLKDLDTASVEQLDTIGNSMLAAEKLAIQDTSLYEHYTTGAKQGRPSRETVRDAAATIAGSLTEAVRDGVISPADLTKIANVEIDKTTGAWKDKTAVDAYVKAMLETEDQLDPYSVGTQGERLSFEDRAKKRAEVSEFKTRQEIRNAAVKAARQEKAEQARQDALQAAQDKRDAEKAEAESAGFTGYGDYSNEGNDSGFDSSGDGPGEGGSGIGADDTGSTGFGTGTDCLTEDMKVKLNGVVDFVTNIKVGDIIDNYKVKEVLHKHMREGYYAINNELKISNDHPVLANGTWTRPEDLVVGDSINGIPVSSLEYVEQLTPTVSIVIDGESFDVHTENNIYTVHGRYKEVRQEAA